MPIKTFLKHLVNVGFKISITRFSLKNNNASLYGYTHMVKIIGTSRIFFVKSRKCISIKRKKQILIHFVIALEID